LFLAYFALQGMFLFSCSILWLVVVRNQSTLSLHQFWESSFIDLSSAGSALAWLGRCLVEAGNYASRDVGLAIVALGVLGGVSLWRRTPERVVLLAGPFVLALAGCALRMYPLGGRLLLFLAPSLWLLAARGLVVLAELTPRRASWLRPALSVALLVPAAMWVGRNLVEVTPRAQFREAFEYVDAHWEKGDSLWVSHPQVYEVYHGCPPQLSAYSPADEVAHAASRRRLWLISSFGTRGVTAENQIDCLRATSPEVLRRRRFKGIEVILFAPARNRRESTPVIASAKE
jgi:hypothetical protein